MSTNGNPHPGRSVDFLSRLHDGELTPAERARFEVHRAHCAECRRAAVEFEDAISMFRSARSNPPRADLAARILRKVQSTSRGRVPFPLQFRLDLGWTALLATALLALLITTPIVVRKPQSVPPAPPGRESSAPEVPATAPTPPAVGGRAPVEPQRQTRDRLADGKGAAANLQKAEKEAAPPPIAAARPSRRSPARAAAQSDREPSVPASAEESRAVAMAPAAPSAAGEVAADSAVAKVQPPVKLTIEPIDGFGPAPALRSRTLSGVAPARGREFVLLVDSQGAVRKVTVRKDTVGEARDADLRSEATGEDRVAASVEKLQFEPGKRPRRLLVRIE